MTTTEKLQLVRVRCVELLAIAEKRTPGKWEQKPEELHRDYIRIRGTRLGGRFKVCNVNGSTGNNESYEREAKETRANANFIASCAGPAEAGWRSTIAAIDFILNNPPIRGLYRWNDMAVQIAAAWPDELLGR